MKKLCLACGEILRDGSASRRRRQNIDPSSDRYAEDGGLFLAATCE